MYARVGWGGGGKRGKGDFFGRCEIDSYEPTHREKGSGAGVPEGRSTFSSTSAMPPLSHTVHAWRGCMYGMGGQDWP